MHSLTLSAPAKINLFLRVLKKRADGYHDLQTAFQFVSLCDQLHFEKTTGSILERNYDLPGVDFEQDLVVKAAKALFKFAGLPVPGVKITLQKNIPTGAGLGGGSSDAATVLLGLNTLFSLGVSSEELQKIGLKLGADVPVFVRGVSAWAEGVGELLTPMKFPKSHFVLVYPQINVNTGEIFSHSRLTRRDLPIRMCASSIGSDYNKFRNDCEDVVFALHPEVKLAYDQLSHYGRVRMSGTGSTLFVSAVDEEKAKDIAVSISEIGKVFVVRGLNVSPATKELESIKLSSGS